MKSLIFAIAVALWSLATYGFTMVVSALWTPQPVRMDLEFLRFENGHFYQHIVVSGADAITGEWSARIWRDDGHHRQLLCSGGGHFPYDGSPSRAMTPSYWTGDDCPDLKPGDHALAAWEYTDERGIERRFSKSLTIP